MLTPSTEMLEMPLTKLPVATTVYPPAVDPEVGDM
jgi:hypothetical protein